MSLLTTGDGRPLWWGHGGNSNCRATMFCLLRTYDRRSRNQDFDNVQLENKVYKSTAYIQYPPRRGTVRGNLRFYYIPAYKHDHYRCPL